MMFYNQHQLYRRGCTSERGNICEWSRFSPMVLLEALTAYDPVDISHQHQPFRFTHGPGYAHNYLGQRMIVKHVLSTNTPNTLFVEEMLMRVLEHAIADVYASHKSRTRFSHKEIQQAHTTLAQHAQLFLSSNVTPHFSLTDLATQLHCYQIILHVFSINIQAIQFISIKAIYACVPHLSMLLRAMSV